MSNTNFLSSLTPLNDFHDLADMERFTAVPKGWSIYCCDITNSTKAIERGEYKAVNMVGAACIMAAINAAGETEIAYVFGGDGATIAAPGILTSAISDALARTRSMAQANFSMDLRIGLVPVETIRKQGLDLKVAMLELSPGNRTALFAGGGAQLADKLVKEDLPGVYSIPEITDPPNLEGLSCRWEPLAAKHGLMVCYLISVVSKEQAQRARIYGDLIQKIEQILSPDLDASRPVRRENMVFRWPPRGLVMEYLATRGKSGWKYRMFLYLQSLLQSWAERFNFSLGSYKPPTYRVELRDNSDYRRFDDVLRMILDLTPEQHQQIEVLLESAATAGQVTYGAHCTDEALMTCLVFSLEESRHIHFIDGTKGGFTYAAKQMKKMKTLSEKRVN